jgi:Ser/Thr protein kinase RdoA (MazF antagonist)
MNTLRPIAQQFAKTITHISPMGNGLINDTFLVTAASSRFVLQRINSKVFPEPRQIMDNLMVLNQHVKQKQNTAVKLQIPELLKTIDQQNFYQDEFGDYWRALGYIEKTESLETIGNLNQAAQAGYALGHFHQLLSDLKPSLLHDTLPGFHITPDYFARYEKIVAELPKQGASENQYCAQFIEKFQPKVAVLETAKQQGLLSLRVIHGDPKLNNFLFDLHGEKIISIIDLDTVKPGLIHYDIGDCLRSCCHNVVSNEFDLDSCAALLTAYLSETRLFFSAEDYEYLYAAIYLIPFELGLRFYTDYLEGNSYFKVTYPKQNLQRAEEQFRLCESILGQETGIRSLIEAASKPR